MGDNEQNLRERREAQRAHDILYPLVSGDVQELIIDPQTMIALHSSLDVLCWILKHDHNDSFTKNLANIEMSLSEAGIEVKEKNETEVIQ